MSVKLSFIFILAIAIPVSNIATGDIHEPRDDIALVINPGIFIPLTQRYTVKVLGGLQ